MSQITSPVSQKEPNLINDWVLFDPNNPPEKGKPLWYFFDVVGVHLGYFDGGHSFSGNSGFLTGDVTHWMYAEEFSKGLISEESPTDYLNAESNIWFKFEISKALDLIENRACILLNDLSYETFNYHWSWSLNENNTQLIKTTVKRNPSNKSEKLIVKTTIEPVAWIKYPKGPELNR